MTKNICSSKTFINNISPGKVLRNKVELVASEFKTQNLEDFYKYDNNVFVTNTEAILENPTKFYSPELFTLVPKNETLLLLTNVKISKNVLDKKNTRYKCDFLFLWNEKVWLIKHSFPDLILFDNIYEILDKTNQ